MLPFIIPVMDGEISKGDVAQSKVKEVVGERCFFKAFDLNLGFGIEKLGDFPKKRVQFNAIKVRVFHCFRKVPKESTHAHAELQDISPAKAHLGKCVIHALNHSIWRVKTAEGRSCHCLILFRIKLFPEKSPATTSKNIHPTVSAPKNTCYLTCTFNLVHSTMPLQTLFFISMFS